MNVSLISLRLSVSAQFMWKSCYPRSSINDLWFRSFTSPFGHYYRHFAVHLYLYLLSICPAIASFLMSLYFQKLYKCYYKYDLNFVRNASNVRIGQTFNIFLCFFRFVYFFQQIRSVLSNTNKIEDYFWVSLHYFIHQFYVFISYLNPKRILYYYWARARISATLWNPHALHKSKDENYDSSSYTNSNCPLMA